MKKHIVSLLLVFTMICSLLPTIAIATGESLNVQESNEGGEKLVVVTYVVPNAVNVTSIQLNVKFDTSKLEARDINWPSIPGFGPPIGSNATETNTNGFFGCSWSVADNTMTPANLNLVTAKFAIKSGASGSADFTITDLVIADENTDDHIAASGATQTGATYTIPKSPISSVTASVEAPAAGVALGTSVDVGGATAYIGTVKWYVGETEAAEIIAKANTKYTAKITLTANTGESFADSVTIPTGYTKDSSSTSSKLVLTKTFDVTGSLPAASVGTAPTAKTGLKYKGTEQELVDPGAATGGNMQYSLDNNSWSDNIPKGKNAGDYTVYYKVKGDSTHSDYTPSPNTVTVKIGQKSIADSTVTIASIPDQTYTGSAITPDLVVTDGTTPLVKGTDYTVSHPYNNNTNVGLASLQVDGKGNYTGWRGETFNIRHATQTISGPGSVEVAFGTTKDLKTVYSSNMPGAALTFAKPATSSMPSGTTFNEATGTVTAGNSAGSFEVTVNSAGNANYNAALQRTITVYIKDKIPSTYATEPTAKTGLEYDGSEQKLVTEGAANGGTVKYSLNGTTWTDTVPKGKNAGTYNVQYKIEGDATHKDTAPHTHTVEIGHKQVTVSGITAANKKYDGKNTATVDASGANFTGKVDGDTLTITPTGTFADANVGENKTVNLSLGTLGGADSANYKLAAAGNQATATANITPATLTITNAAITAKTYDGSKNADVTGVTFSGLQNSETLAVGTDYTVSGVFNSENVNDANTVTVSVTLKDTPKTKNYTLPTATHDEPATIAKAATPAAPIGLTGVKDQPLSTVSLAAHPGWSWADDTVTMNTVGSQNFDANYHDANGNYADGTKPVIVNVLDKTDAGVTISSVPAGKTYGDASFTLTATKTAPDGGTWSWASSDDTILKIVSGGNTAAATVQVLKADTTGATLTATYDSATHYGTFTTASIPVAKKAVTVAPKAFSITKGSAIPTFELVYTGLVSGESLTPTPAPIFTCYETGTTPVSTSTAAGTYTITWTNMAGTTFTGDANYAVTTTATANLTISNPSYSGGGGGGGSSHSSRYDITVDKTENGTITISPKSASKGDTMTVTVKPDKGYELDSIKVLDQKGGKVKLTEKNGKYTFTMPDSKVTVTAEFAEVKAASTFADVPADAYYAKAVEWAVKKGITNGKAEGLFGSGDPCTRGQIVTFLWRAAGSPAPKGTAKVPSDVLPGSYCYDAVAWAIENGITNGLADGTFGVGSTCTRGQSVTFLYRTMGTAPTTANGFTDVEANAFCADAVAWAVENGVTNGTSTSTFSPGSGCTRAQIVTFLYRAYQGK